MAAYRLVRKKGDDVLRKKSKKVDNITPRIITLLEDMAETMKKHNGVGLAAPQVGILRRVVTIDVGEGLIELINPEFAQVSDKKVVDVEGCLSVPEKYGEVERPERVRVRALDRNGKEFEIEGEGLLARALCHEIDHLDGVLFTDKVKRYIDINQEQKD